MRIGIDASNLRAGGGVTHLVELLRAADPRAHGFEQVTVWAGSGTLSRIEDRDWLIKVSDPLLNRLLPYRVYWQRFRLKGLAALAGCDVLLVPGGSDASGFKPLVTMSRNLLPFEWREMRRYGFSWSFIRIALLHLIQKRTFRKAEGLIFLTQYARDTVMASVGRSDAKMAVISHGIDGRFYLAPRTQRGMHEFTDAEPCRLLYVSSVDAYKHQWHVAQAAAQLRAAGVPVVLDLVGPAYSPAIGRLHETLQRIDLDARFIRYLGEIPYGKLHELYAAADIDVFASSCENMPNILLEGMASGLPIACSNRGPMPEVLGDAGVYFDPERPDDIVAAILRLIESPELRGTKAQAAYERARQFSWPRCAAETFAFIVDSAVSHKNKTR